MAVLKTPSVTYQATEVVVINLEGMVYILPAMMKDSFWKAHDKGNLEDYDHYNVENMPNHELYLVSLPYRKNY